MAEGKDEYTDWKEFRRFRAWELYQNGMKQCDIADVLDVTPGAVSQWVNRAKREGPKALEATKAPGPTPKLDRKHVPELLEMLEEGAQAHGFRGEVWTCKRVAEVIDKEFGVSYHPDHVRKLLRQWGCTPQKPERRARQIDPEKTEEFAKRTWPEVKKSAE